jgi:hypothetical protein
VWENAHEKFESYIQERRKRERQQEFFTAMNDLAREGLLFTNFRTRIVFSPSDFNGLKWWIPIFDDMCKEGISVPITKERVKPFIGRIVAALQVLPLGIQRGLLHAMDSLDFINTKDSYIAVSNSSTLTPLSNEQVSCRVRAGHLQQARFFFNCAACSQDLTTLEDYFIHSHLHSAPMQICLPATALAATLLSLAGLSLTATWSEVKGLHFSRSCVCTSFRCDRLFFGFRDMVQSLYQEHECCYKVIVRTTDGSLFRAMDLYNLRHRYLVSGFHPTTSQVVGPAAQPVVQDGGPPYLSGHDHHDWRFLEPQYNPAFQAWHL